jgi:integrase
MQGSMRQRVGAWELRVYVGRDPLSGRKRWVSRSFKGAKRDAQVALAALVTELDGNRPGPSGATVGHLLERWFEQAEPDFSPKTALETRGVLDRHLIPSLGAVPLGRLRAEQLDGYYRELRRRGGHGGKPLAPATVRRMHGILHRALEQGVRWGWLRSNPASLAQPPKVPPSEIVPPDPAHIARLFEVARERDPDLATFVLLAAATGARRSELVALRWSDVDLDTGVVSISRGHVHGRDGVVMKDTKTHASRRVALAGTSLAVLVEHHGRATDLASACGVALGTDGFVFTRTADGTVPWRPDTTTTAFVHLRHRAGLDHIRLHDLRHYVATTMLTAGVDVRTVAGRLGHRNAATTLNVYSHFLERSDRAAADILGGIFDEAMAQPDADR